MSGHDTQVMKGILSMLLLRVVNQSEDYGYSIVLRLQDLGFDDLGAHFLGAGSHFLLQGDGSSNTRTSATMRNIAEG